MAVTSIKNTSAFVLSYKVGVDENNKDIFVSQKFSKINNQATDEQILLFLHMTNRGSKKPLLIFTKVLCSF